MNNHLASSHQELVARHGEILAPGSAEAQAVEKAFELASSGDTTTAGQILQYLNIPDEVKQEIHTAVVPQKSAPVSTVAVDPVMPTPLPAESQSGPGEVASSPLPPVPPASEIEIPVPVPIPSDVAMAEVPMPPVDMTEEPEAAIKIPDLGSEVPLPPMGSAAPIPAKEGVDEVPLSIPANPLPEIDTRHEDLDEILSQRVVGEGGHLGRVHENKNLLEEVIDKKEEKQEKTIPSSYDAIFKEPHASSAEFEVPGVIKTYDTSAADRVSDRQSKVIVQKEVEKGRKLFEKAEKYLQKAYESGNEHIIASAERQLANLRTRYPDYVQQNKEHIEKLEAMKHTVVAEEVASVQTLESVELAGVAVKPTMRISGEKYGYVVDALRQEGGEVMIYFTNDETQARYKVPSVDLEKALGSETLDPDDFFGKFLQSEE